MQVLIDWEDPISKTHILAVAIVGGIGGQRHMIRCAADEFASTILAAMQDWADDATRKQPDTRPSNEAGVDGASYSQYDHEDGTGD